jgi:hypothetical protein
MPERHAQTAEFDATVDRSGYIRIPDHLIGELGLAAGGKLSVRITGKQAMAALKRSGVTNEEIDRIAAMQLEPSGQVVKFLLSEGALREGGRNRRRGPGVAG